MEYDVNLFPPWLFPNLYWLFAFWNFRAGLRKWDTFPLTYFKLYEKERPICNKLLNWILAESNQVLRRVDLTQLSSSHTSHNTPNAKARDASSFWARTACLVEHSGSWFAGPVFVVTRRSLPWFLALCFGREGIPIPQCSYCNILITNLVGEEGWLTS